MWPDYACCKASNEPVERAIVYAGWEVHLVLVADELGVVTIPKYVFPGRGPLRSRVVRERLERLTWHYRPGEVARYARLRDPCLGGPVPSVQRVDTLVCDPECRRQELLEASHDELELLAASLVAELEARGVIAHPTGSILGYYHDPDRSDIDLVVYLDMHARGCSDVLQVLTEILEPLPPSEREAWAAQHATHPSCYRVYMRGYYRGKRVSIVYAVRQRRRCSYTLYYEPANRMRVRVCIEPWACNALLWPHYAEAVGPRGEPYYVVSFDGVYAPLLYEGGCYEVEGAAGRAVINGEERAAIILGLSEVPARLRPLQPRLS